MIDKPMTNSEQAQVDQVKQQIRLILGELIENIHNVLSNSFRENENT